MAERYIALKDGAYIFSETEKPNVYFFYREDGNTLEVQEINEHLLRMYHSYIIREIRIGHIPEGCAIMHLKIQVSDDKQVVRIIVF